MKSMTCRQLGGKCDQKLSANSWDEMVKVMTKHVMEKHPDVAKIMEKMHNEDPKKWGREMKPKWDAAAESGGEAARTP
jgi:predicted small metal-binding protein